MPNPVPNPIQRLRYFDGEYLRSYDFADEQTYHMEMRRLMNLKLHLYGIVYGLEIVQDQDSVSGGPYFYSVAPGIAIDQMGREIVVPAPYSLSNILTAPGLGSGNYEVWICYQETQTGLPAAGYLDCNAPNQSTRWQEGFQVYLKPMQGQSLVMDCGGVRLGAVTLTNPSGMVQFAGQSYNWGRHYVGIRAQSVIAPDQVDSDTFDITAQTTPVPDRPLPGYLDVHPGVFNRGNVFVKQNLVVGDDFVLSPSDPNLPTFTPPISGDLKVSNDLFLKGNLYGFDSGSGKWYPLQQLIQSLMPFDVYVSPTPLTINLPTSPITANGAGNSYTNQLPVTPPPPSVLATVTKATVLLAISSIGWQSGSVLQAHWSGDTDGFLFSVSPVVPAITNPLNVSIQYTVGPISSDASALPPITSLVVNYIVLFQP